MRRIGRFWKLGWMNRKTSTALRGDETFRGETGKFPVGRGDKETRFKQDFETRVDEAYRRRGRRVWLKVVSYAAMLALPIIVGMLLWTRQPVEEVVDYGIGPIEHGVRKATLVLNDGKSPCS